MIALATFIAAETWGNRHREGDPHPGEAIVTLGLLYAFGWFDLHMASIVFG